jgi:hypothetical protein
VISSEEKAREVGLKIMALLREYQNTTSQLLTAEVSLGNEYFIESWWEDDTRNLRVELVKYEPGKRLVIE